MVFVRKSQRIHGLPDIPGYCIDYDCKNQAAARPIQLTTEQAEGNAASRSLRRAAVQDVAAGSRPDGPRASRQSRACLIPAGQVQGMGDDVAEDAQRQVGVQEPGEVIIEPMAHLQHLEEQRDQLASGLSPAGSSQGSSSITVASAIRYSFGAGHLAIQPDSLASKQEDIEAAVRRDVRAGRSCRRRRRP